ncbi:MAG: hypothetical protein LBC02_12340 [Planctomycetaceae bacterium]|nr:hypothetical protein [Planctomycetaceae bacterium]
MATKSATVGTQTRVGLFDTNVHGCHESELIYFSAIPCGHCAALRSRLPSLI